MIRGVGIYFFLEAIYKIGGYLGLLYFFIFLFVVVVLSLQWHFVRSENKEAQKLFCKLNNISKNGRVSSKELVLDIELFNKMEEHFNEKNIVEKKDIEIAVKMNELQCENLRIKIDNMTAINSFTTDLIAIACSTTALVVALCSVILKTIPIELLLYIGGVSVLFVIMPLEQSYVSDIRIKSKLLQYNYSRLERIWLEQIS